MTVIWTEAPARARAALRPPKPAPTITTRGITLRVILLLCPHLYKIQRDGRRFQKFFGKQDSGVGSSGDAFGRRPDFCRAAVCDCVYSAVGAPAGGCRDRVAHSSRAADSGDARDPACGFVFFNDGGPALVCLGVVVRPSRGPVGRCAWTQRRNLSDGGGERGRICLDVSFGRWTRSEHVCGAGFGVARLVGVDDSLSGSPACDRSEER